MRDLHVCVPLRLRLVDVVEEPERVDAVWEGRAALDQARIDSLLQVFVRLAGARLGALGDGVGAHVALGNLGRDLGGHSGAKEGGGQCGHRTDV